MDEKRKGIQLKGKEMKTGVGSVVKGGESQVTVDQERHINMP